MQRKPRCETPPRTTSPTKKTSPKRGWIKSCVGRLCDKKKPSAHDLIHFTPGAPAPALALAPAALNAMPRSHISKTEADQEAKLDQLHALQEQARKTHERDKQTLKGIPTSFAIPPCIMCGKQHGNAKCHQDGGMCKSRTKKCRSRSRSKKGKKTHRRHH